VRLRLEDVIEVRHRSVRAVSLDVDRSDPEVLRGYVAGEHVLDALRRVAISLQPEPRTRAFSITGPYGSGKSSFALLLSALLSPKSDPAHRAAIKLLRQADPQLADTFVRERRGLGVSDRGLISAMVTAHREPISAALLRALCRGAEEFWKKGGKPSLLRRLREAVEADEHDQGFVLGVFDELSETAPVLVVVDELGKNLEYAAEHPGDDLYLLQQLAERLSSRPGFSGALVTLAHLGFEDYLGGAGDARRREWRKVHGRFEDVPFVANTAHSIGLLADALAFTGPSDLRQVVEDRCTTSATKLAGASGSRTLGDLAADAGAVYPLHPSVAIALPPLVAQLGQHDRSLVAFLTSEAPHALPALLSGREIARGQVPFVRLDDLYDYFFGDGAIVDLTGPGGERAREVAGRIEDARGLDEVESRVLKAVGVLNVLGGPERLVASAEVMAEAMTGPDGTRNEEAGIRSALERLVERSLLTFRDFAGEYRVWEGSDFDTAGQIRAARERLEISGGEDRDVLATLEEVRPLRPAVARRHGQRHHVLRYLECRYEHEVPDEVTARSADADGVVLYVLAGRKAPPKLPSKTADGLPLVVVWSPYGAEVGEAALEFAAARAVLDGAPELERDAVARREMRHRVTALQRRSSDRVEEAFAHERRGVYWFHSGKRERAGAPAGFSRLLSDICDERYPLTPIVRNEMVNRRELTSQGAKARRMVLEAMFTHEHEENLGIEGFGPERAMYEAVLSYTGLHRQRGDGWAFGEPPKGSDMAKVWGHLTGLLDAAVEEPISIDAIYDELTGPPFGMKVGVLPILLAAALQYRAEDVFLYQDGSFQPVVEPAHVERLLKTPERFALKRAALVGVRASVFERLRGALAPAPTTGSAKRPQTRNETTLVLVRPLIAFAGSLPEYTKKTSRASTSAHAVCVALLEAREPDELLFTALPAACGVEPFVGNARSQDETAVSEYVDRLRAALAELGSEYQRLLEKIGDLLHGGFGGTGPRRALREEFRSRSRPLLKQVIEPKMRAFLATACDEHLDDEDWIAAMAMSLISKPPSSWTDHDVGLFEALVAERAQWFRRLELLYHELHGPKGDGFDARRVTLTAPDGTERAELVRVDHATQGLVADVLDEALGKLQARLGTDAAQALLGILSDRLLSTASGTTEDASVEERKVGRR
jgi:hypothetical protein